MALFQSAVLNNYLNSIDDTQVEDAWSRFTEHFHNPEIQDNIRNSKEEEYQDGFLSDLFVNVLGYTKYPAPGYNLKVEQRDEKGSRKSDGALYVDDKVVAIIELKGTETTNLEKVESQAFGYKVNHRHADYVIISNFEKLRFYIDNAVEHLEFNLFKLTKAEFKILWLCLENGNVKKGQPKKIKESSLTQNEEITKKLYADYSAFKDSIFQSIVKNNPDYDKLHLFKKTQKLLDRFLFIFFAEDQQLLPANSIKLIITEWQQLRELDEYRPLYDRFVKYFGYLNVGRKTPGKEEIFPYNGGLFAEDEILDNIILDDEILYKHTLQLSKYNFASEVDVNILGHIFEHSLNEIEEITAELEGQKVDRSKTRRKKDGVYYTPKYITQYIVENTVGKLCEEKKAELQIEDEEYRPNRQKATKKTLLGNLETYREWLLKLTICDPACGSGAFLNQALEFLLNEHHYIDELQAKLLEESIVYPDIEASILENNLYGVDINEESVEIAKLSLWLRTAQKGRKLTSLNNHIKCGNSIIDDSAVAGDKAFKWEEEFPDVFAKGGFDVVIGNPPYGASFNKGEQKYYQSTYNMITTNVESYIIFFEKSMSLISEKKYLGFITPDTFLRKGDFEYARGQILSKYQIHELVETGPVFKDARDTWCIISVIKNNAPNRESKILHKRLSRYIVSIEDRLAAFESNDWDNHSYVSQKIWLQAKSKIIGYLATEPKQIIIQKLSALNRIGDIENLLVSRGEEGGKNKFKFDEFGDFFMIIPEEIDKYYCGIGWKIKSEKLSQGKLESIYSYPKIWIIRIQKMRWHQRIVCGFDERKNSASMKTLQTLVTKISDIDDLKCLQAILSSKLINFWSVNFLSDDINGGFIESLPIPINYKNQRLIIVVDQMINLKKIFYKHIDSVSIFLQEKFNIEKLSRKLQNWHKLTFKQFLNELKKKKVSLSLSEEAEWMEYFNQQKAKADEFKIQITQTDKEVDEMVYELYGLSEDEIGVVEG